MVFSSFSLLFCRKTPALTKVEYKKDEPYLHKKLFCKLPHKPGGSDRYFVSCMWNHDRPAKLHKKTKREHFERTLHHWNQNIYHIIELQVTNIIETIGPCRLFRNTSYITRSYMFFFVLTMFFFLGRFTDLSGRNDSLQLLMPWNGDLFIWQARDCLQHLSPRKCSLPRAKVLLWRFLVAWKSRGTVYCK